MAFVVDTVEALPRVLLFYSAIVVLHLILPAFVADGYACDWTGRPLRYRLNGPLVLAATVAAWAVLPPDLQSYAAINYWACLGASNLIGLVAALLLFVCTGSEPACRCLTVDQKDLRERAVKGEDVCRTAITPSPPRTIAAHFFFGRSFNPRLLGVDLKMLLYAFGACALSWNVLSAAALREQLMGGPRSSLSTAQLLYSALLGWFIVEYMLLEVVHLYTYDFMCEKLGFKLCWGCCLFYPFFYCIGVWSLVTAPSDSDLSAGVALAIGLLFAGGWLLTRGANIQKFVFKRDPSRTSWLGLPMRVVPGTRLLCSGFWGLARHVNYCGEIVQAIALALPGSLVAADRYYSALPWLYPLYYVAILLPRQVDDDLQIATKYGEAAFADYTKRVPYRVVPRLW